jgi:hypothetical protein
MYSKISTNLNVFKLDIPKTIVPEPAETDYEIGFIRRYFCQKSNDANSYLFEIDENEFRKLSESPFWVVTDIKWRISGPIERIYKDNGSLADIGVIASNKAAIAFGAFTIKNIGLYLPNLLQFYK